MFQPQLTLIFVAAIAVSGNIASAQQSGQRSTSATPSPELWKVLQDWSDGSSQIKYLTGNVVRNTYLMKFEQEKVARGKFWFGSPDKGRLDIAAVDITQKMLAERNNPNAKIKRKANGEAFEFVSDEPKRWLCDGERIYNIDDQRKTAEVMMLPPNERGANIMNSPLPFLFGMPPNDAIQRYDLTLDKDYRPQYDVVKVSAKPRRMRDKQAWQVAEIFLDTKTWVPTAVKMVDPTGDTHTVYSFKDISFRRPILQDPWDPKIKGYKINVIQDGQGPSVAQQPKAAAAGNVFPNVVGQTHTTAKKALIAAGIPEKNIRMVNAGPAPKQSMTYRVRQQRPAADAPIDRTVPVELYVFDKPKQLGQ